MSEVSLPPNPSKRLTSQNLMPSTLNLVAILAFQLKVLNKYVACLHAVEEIFLKLRVSISGKIGYQATVPDRVCVCVCAYLDMWVVQSPI